MFVFLLILCSSIIISTSHVFTTSAARDSTITFEIVNSTFKFFVYDYKGWKCTVNVDGSSTDITPPNQRGYVLSTPHNSQITFYFLEDLIFSIQFIIAPNLTLPGCVFTHPSDDLIPYLQEINVWHPFHTLFTGNDGLPHFALNSNYKPEYIFYGKIDPSTTQIIEMVKSEKTLTSAGTLNTFPVLLSLKKQTKAIISIPYRIGSSVFLIKSESFELLDPNNTVVQFDEDERLLIVHPLSNIKKEIFNFIAIPKDSQCNTIHINRQHERIVSLGGKQSSWSKFSVATNISKSCLLYASDEVQTIRIDYVADGSDNLYVVRPDKRTYLTKSGNTIFPASIFMIVPHKESGVTMCTYFVLNDLSLALKGSSLTLPFSSVWNEDDAFKSVYQPDKMVIDTPFASFSFDKSLILIFTSTNTIFHIWNSLPGQPCEISAIVYSSKNVLIQVLPQNNFTYKFIDEPGYIIISVNSKNTLYHAYTQQNITDVADFPFRCNDFVITSELSSSLKFGHSNSNSNYTFKKAWSTCIFYDRLGNHKLSVTNPFTRQIKVDVYDYPKMSVCDETQEYFTGPLFVHIKILIPPNAGSIDITDTCLTNCSDLYPKTLTRMINPFAEGGDAISVHELVANMSTRRQIIILGVLFFMLVIVLLIAIATCFGMIFFYGITFSSSDYMQGNNDDFVDDCRYPMVGKNKVPQAIEPAAFQPVMPASYYLSAPL